MKKDDWLVRSVADGVCTHFNVLVTIYDAQTWKNIIFRPGTSANGGSFRGITHELPQVQI